jgi:hypothetical protein
MTILSAIQDACTSGIALDKPTSVVGSATREHLELASIAQEMAEMIANSHEWEAFNTLATITGDGSTEDFDMPSDYDRMLTKSQLWSSSLETPLTPISDRDRWLELDIKTFDFVVNAWIKYGGQIHIKPALANAVTAKYWYQSNKIIVAADGTTTKTDITSDTDVFRLDERLLKLGVVWKWREMKGLSYAEDLNTYERLLAKRINQDKGSRMIRVGRVRMPGDAKVAYPTSITG